MRATISVLTLPAVLVGCEAAVLPTPLAAPDRCGFPEGTALVFAGRSTTGALGVNEVASDPLQNDPADIYITRDEFDQGDEHGRLACAIFVEHSFAEITVVPDGWGPPAQGETAAPVIAEPTATPTPVPTRPASGLTHDQAMATARDAVPEARGWMGFARAGPVDEASLALAAGRIPEDRWVWTVSFSRGDRGFFVIIDYETGEVYVSTALILD